MGTNLAGISTSNLALDNTPRTETGALIVIPVSSAPPPVNITQLFEEESGNTGGADQPAQAIMAAYEGATSQSPADGVLD